MCLKKNHSRKKTEKKEAFETKDKSLLSKISDGNESTNYTELLETILEKVIDNDDALVAVFSIATKEFVILSKAENLNFLDFKTLDNLVSIIHPDDQAEIKLFFEGIESSKSKTNKKFRIINTRDSKEIKYFIANILEIPFNKESNRFFIFIKDISKQTKKKLKVEKIKERAKESEILKTVFLSNISHHIRTPMNTIVGFAEILSISDLGKEKRKEFLHIIKTQSKNLLNLIDDISEITKFESGKQSLTKSRCNLNLLLNEVFIAINEQRTSKSKEEVELKFTKPKAEGYDIFTDAGRLHQVIYNLLYYSIKHTNKGHIHFGYYPPEEGKIRFYVKDTSPGLTKQEQKNLFHKFTTIELSEQSKLEEPALGLTLAQYIVKLLGGRIWVESEPGSGSNYFFTIQYEKVPKANIKEIEEEADLLTQYDWRNKVILIVEDEEVNSMFIEAILQDTHVQMIYAKNGHQAIELCKTLPKLDLILMDIKMPVMNGLKATQEIRKFNTQIPIIAQTALVADDDTQKCLEAGCNDVITKPIEVEELLGLIHKFLSD